MNEYTDYVVDNKFKSVRRSKATFEQQMKTKLCRNMFRWWHSFAPHIPQRREFDILDHVKAAGNVFLIEFLEDNQFTYKIQGEEVAEIIGSRNAGKVFSVDCGDADLENFARYLTEFKTSRSAIHTLGTMEAFGRPLANFEAFDMPLVNEKNELSHVLGVVTRLI